MADRRRELKLANPGLNHGLIRRLTKLRMRVAQVHGLFSVLFDAQWYSSESHPPGKRRIVAPLSLNREIVVGAPDPPFAQKLRFAYGVVLNPE